METPGSHCPNQAMIVHWGASDLVAAGHMAGFAMRPDSGCLIVRMGDLDGVSR